MKTRTVKITVMCLIAFMMLSVSAVFARNKTDEPETAEVVSIKATGKVDGVVKDLVTGKPIKNAVVSVEGCKTGAMTNETGKFFLRDLPCGSCLLNVTKAGYTASESVMVVNESERTVIIVQLKTQAG